MKEEPSIHTCIDNLDFDRIKSVMKHLDWVWAFAENKYPTKSEMIKTIHSLYNSCIECFNKEGKGIYNVSTGGFVVSCGFGKKKLKWIRVRFELCSSESPL